MAKPHAPMPLQLLQVEPTQLTLLRLHRLSDMRPLLLSIESVFHHPRSLAEFSQHMSLYLVLSFLKETSTPSSLTSKMYIYSNKELAMDTGRFGRSSCHFIHIHVYLEMLCWTDCLDLNPRNHTGLRRSRLHIPL